MVNNIKRLHNSSELWLDSSPTKFKSDWMCGIYSRMSACLFYRTHLSVCPDINLCIYLPLTSTLGGGDVKCIINNISTKHCVLHRFTWYSRVYCITPEWRYYSVTNLYCTHTNAYPNYWSQLHQELLTIIIWQYTASCINDVAD